ncbi:MAG: hypothetical protein QM657_04465 [Lacrimispora sp.]|uniref:hypothetical protein n=1 Tax=Lacrimispora sp. TaxID=2719234 RepID=UPI0039E60CF9
MRQRKRKLPVFAVVFIALIFSAGQGMYWGDGIMAAEAERSVDGAGDKREVVVETEIPPDEREGYVPPGEYVDQEGKQYWLKEWRLESYMIPERLEMVERTVVYEEVEWEDQIPRKAVIDLRDDAGGRQVREEYPILRISQKGERWIADFRFTAVFHSYDADYYWLGEKKIPFNGSKPELKDCSRELLAEIGADPERYRILDFVWQGEPYSDERGVICRDALVTGEKKVSEYHVIYGGEALFRETEGIKCVAVYRGFDSVTDGWGVAEEDNMEPGDFSLGDKEKKGKWLIIRDSVVVTISVLLIVTLLALLISGGVKMFRKKKGVWK